MTETPDATAEAEEISLGELRDMIWEAHYCPDVFGGEAELLAEWERRTGDVYEEDDINSEIVCLTSACFLGNGSIEIAADTASSTVEPSAWTIPHHAAGTEGGPWLAGTPP